MDYRGELKLYRVVLLRNGEYGIILPRYIFTLKRKIKQNCYNGKIQHRDIKFFDIMKIFDSVEDNICNASSFQQTLDNIEKQDISILWERDETDWNEVKPFTKILFKKKHISDKWEKGYFIKATNNGFVVTRIDEFAHRGSEDDIYTSECILFIEKGE